MLEDYELRVIEVTQYTLNKLYIAMGPQKWNFVQKVKFLAEYLQDSDLESITNPLSISKLT